MLNELVLPPWCSKVIVVADAAYASRQNLQAIQARHWWFVIAFPRTWKFTDGHSLRDLVAHLPHVYYRKVRLPLIGSRARYRVFWTFAKPTALREVGDVTVVLSKRRRNDGPKNTKVLVTNLPQATAHGTATVYLRRWPVELFFKEWKEVVGVGQHQVTKDAARVERSAGAGQRHSSGPALECLRPQAPFRLGGQCPALQTLRSATSSPGGEMAVGGIASCISL